MIIRGAFLALLSISLGLAQHNSSEAQREAREQYSRLLVNPARDPWQMPAQVVATLNFSSSEVVGLTGDDDGYFARWIAPRVKQTYILASRAAATKKALLEEVPITIVVVGDLTSPPPTPLQLDTLIVCDMLDQIKDRPTYYLNLLKLLKSGGRLVVIDFFKNSAPKGLSVPDRSTVLQELRAAGLRLSAEYTFLPLQFFVVMR